MDIPARWTFFTNHVRVLLTIVRDPAVRLRDIAATCTITERTAQSIVGDLEQAGYLRRKRMGRRTDTRSSATGPCVTRPSPTRPFGHSWRCSPAAKWTPREPRRAAEPKRISLRQLVVTHRSRRRPRRRCPTQRSSRVSQVL